MPYIEEKDRVSFDIYIDKTVQHIQNEGDLNYCIYSLMKKWLEKQKPINYSKLSSCIAAFECAKLEFYRKVISKYEDLKCKKNGEIDPIFLFEEENGN